MCNKFVGAGFYWASGHKHKHKHNLVRRTNNLILLMLSSLGITISKSPRKTKNLFYRTRVLDSRTTTLLDQSLNYSVTLPTPLDTTSLPELVLSSSSRSGTPHLGLCISVIVLESRWPVSGISEFCWKILTASLKLWFPFLKGDR